MANPVIIPEIDSYVRQQVRELVALLMKRPITEEIAMQVESYDGFEDLEIEDGQWVGLDDEKDEFMGSEEHGWIEFNIMLLLGIHVKTHKLGRLYPGDTVFVLEGKPDEIQLKRRPDIAFMQHERVKHSKGYVYGAPDIAIETISPTERPGKIRKKLNEYLSHGVKQVWHVLPEVEEITIHLPDGTSKTYKKGDVILADDLLPGFTLDVAKVFEE